MEVSFMADNGNLDRIAQEQSSPKSKDRLSA